MIDYSKYQDLETESRKGRRYYLTPSGGAYPSVTTILSATKDMSFLFKWREKIGHEEAARITKESANIGTKVHSYMEKFYEGNIRDIKEFFEYSGIMEEDKEVRKLVLQMLKKTNKNNLNVLASEIALYNDDLKYAGRVDVVGTWNDYLVILDYKTSRSKKRPEWVFDYKLQCTAYALAHNKMFDTDIKYFVIVIGVRDGDEAQLFFGSVSHYESSLKGRINEFYAKK